MDPGTRFGAAYPARGEDRTGPARLAGVALLVAIALLGPIAGQGVSAAAPPMTVPRTGGSATNTSFNGNLNVSVAGPTSTSPAGTQLSVSYRAWVPEYSTALGPFHVHLPTAVAHFASSAGDVAVTIGPRNLTINGSAATNATPPVSVVLAAATAFLSASPAYLTTGGLAVLSDLPYGSAPVEFQWSWALRLPDGSGESLASAWTNDSPAQYVRVAAFGPVSVVAGTDFTVCLGGPYQGRTFSLHGEDASAVEFGRATVEAPASNASAFCFALGVPAGYPPQPVIFHLWDYEAVPLLVHLFRATVLGGPVGWIDANASPLNLTLTLDGIPVPAAANGAYNISAGAGSHRLFATAPGFWPLMRDVVVAGNQTSFVEMTLALQALSTPSHPPSAFVVAVVIGSGGVGGALLAIAWVRRRRRVAADAPPPGAA